MAATCEAKIRAAARRVNAAVNHPVHRPLRRIGGNQVLPGRVFRPNASNHVGERDMLRKLIIGALVSASAMVALPADRRAPKRIIATAIRAVLMTAIATGAAMTAIAATAATAIATTGRYYRPRTPGERLFRRRATATATAIIRAIMAATTAAAITAAAMAIITAAIAGAAIMAAAAIAAATAPPARSSAARPAP